MNEALLTLNGWYAYHDFRTIDWSAWKALSEADRQQALDELLSFSSQWTSLEADKKGSSAMFNILGHKADLLFVHFRPTLDELIDIKTACNKTILAEVTIPDYSYVSVVELSNYVNKPGSDPDNDPYIQGRLKPIMPKTKHICFYPMNKKREGQDNWYMLSMDERREMMKSHGMIGRSYAGKVTQVIAGSVGLDDWEWGVTLFSDDPLVYKNMIYEMRFDEVSARFGEFGAFYVGNRLTDEDLTAFLKV